MPAKNNHVKKLPEEDQEGNQRRESRSFKELEKGIKEGSDLARVLVAFITDAVDGTLPPDVANTAIRGAEGILTLVELTNKFGRAVAGQKEKILPIL